jgi:putative ATP-binding cassette transporter
MSFFQLFRREMQGSLPRLTLMSVLGGLSNAAILAAVNAGAQAAADGASSLSSAVLFTVSLVVFIKTQNYILITSTVEMEAIIHRLRVRLMDEVRHSELLALDAIGRADIVAAITKETSFLAQATNMLAFAGQGIVLIFFVAIYVAYLSTTAFALAVIIVGGAAALYHAKGGKLATGARDASEWENRLFDRLADLLDGFKEVRLNRSRSADLFDDIDEVSRTAANLKIRTQSEAYKRMIFAQGSTYLLLGAVVFVVPAFSATFGATISKTATALLYAVGWCFGLVQTIPVLAAANAAVDNIERIEAKLRAAVVAEDGTAAQTDHFNTIEMRGIVFRYVDKSAEAVYQVGPLDFILRSGDLVFVTGGNGSGKSTFLKLLAGLYKPELGEITLDGMRVDDRNVESYRALITAIFTDYHLFRRLYGIPDPNPREVDRLLTEFQLLDKTQLVDGEFASLDLSGGQRKRLALVVSLMEKRPILLLDEWTADQDPGFRRKFYDDLLPTMKKAGLTVVAVTHDDRHLDELKLAARRFHMEDGRFVGQQTVENDR